MNLIEAMCECVSEKKNEHTIRAIRNDFYLYIEFLLKKHKIGNAQLSDLNEIYVEQYQEMLIDEHFRISTIGRRVGHLKQLSRWCYDRGLVPKPLKIDLLTEDQICPRSLTKEEEERFRETGLRLVMGGEKGLTIADERKKKAMGALGIYLLETGVRISEAANLERKQIQGDEARNVRGKKKGLRDVILSDECLSALGEYLKIRRDNEPRIWPYGTRTLYRWIVSIGQMCGVKLHPHMLRHTVASRVLENTGNLRMTAQVLGHKNIKNTMRYTLYSRDDIKTTLNNRRKIA